MEEKINLTFSGAGFLAMYQIGVASCFKYYGRKLLDNVNCYGGCSAGAMIALGLLCDIDLEKSVLLLMDTAAKIRDGSFGPLTPSFDPINTIRKAFNATLPSNAYKMATGKLFISLTRVSDWKSVIVSEFNSNKDLIDALTCTTFIPFYCGVQPPKYRGVSYIDGGFTDNLLQHFEGTNITVSVFSGDSDICPSDGHRDNSIFDMNNVTVQFSGQNIFRLLKALFPLDSTSLTDLCRQGFKDTLNYMHLKYPEMLSIDADVVSIPYCCGGYFTEEDRNVLTCCCENEYEDYKFNKIEQKISKEKALTSLIIPEPIYQMLSKVEQMAVERDILYQAFSTMLQISKWLAQPSYYITTHVYYFIYDLFKLMLPKVEEYYSNNFIMKSMLLMAKKAFNAYHDSSKFEWHPSLGEEKKTDIIKTRERLKSAENSFVAIRKVSSSEGWQPRGVSVSSDGTDLPLTTRPTGWSMLSDDVFENDNDESSPYKKPKYSSPSFALLIKTSQTILEYTKGDDDFGNDLNLEDEIEDSDGRHYSDSLDEDDHVSPIYF